MRTSSVGENSTAGRADASNLEVRFPRAVRAVRLQIYSLAKQRDSSLLNRNGRRLYFAGAALLVAAIAALWCDVPLARALASVRLPGEVRKPLELSEVFAHGFGVLAILYAAFLLAPETRRRLARVATCAIGSGLLADVIKLFVARTRPRRFDFDLGVAQSFELALPWSRETGWSHANQSFPSAHTATAVGLAIGLGWLFYRGRAFFGVLAVFAMLQRLVMGSHFLSDVFVGAAIALTVSAICFDQRLVGRWFSRMEQGPQRDLRIYSPYANPPAKAA